jgi:hypothetical protein
LRGQAGEGGAGLGPQIFWGERVSENGVSIQNVPHATRFECFQCSVGKTGAEGS